MKDAIAMIARQSSIAMLVLLGVLLGCDPDVERLTPAASAALSIDALTLRDVENGRTQPLSALTGRNATVMFFGSTECPVSLSYEPEIASMGRSLESDGVAVVVINSNYTDTPEKIRAHAADSKLSSPIFQDIDGRIAAALGVTRNSEVVLLDRQRRAVYQGRVDDRVTIGVRRPHATRYDLREAIDATLAGRPAVVARTEASGCFISQPPAAGAAGVVNYAVHIAPLVERYCVSCHRPGQAGPISLQTYDDVAAWSKTIVEVIEQDRMPPWILSLPDPRFGDFIEMPGPTPEEKELFANWVRSGTPRGNIDLAPPQTLQADDEWSIGKPDVILSMAEAFPVPATGVVPYQYYRVLDHHGEEQWVEAIEIKPGARSVVHHVNLYMSQPKINTVQLGAGERWAAFAPGRVPLVCAPGTARRLPEGASLTLEMHYSPDGVERSDQTRVGLRFARAKPLYELRNIPLGTMNFSIPPHASHHRVVATYTLKDNATLVAFSPHMHYRGKDFRYEAILPDGTKKTLLFVPRFNPNWQLTHVPKEMIALPKGTVLRATAHYDNSAANPLNPDPRVPVTFGLQTFEEMMFGFVDLIYEPEVDSPKLAAIRAADLAALATDMGFAPLRSP